MNVNFRLHSYFSFVHFFSVKCWVSYLLFFLVYRLCEFMLHVIQAYEAENDDGEADDTLRHGYNRGGVFR